MRGRHTPSFSVASSTLYEPQDALDILDKRKRAKSGAGRNKGLFLRSNSKYLIPVYISSFLSTLLISIIVPFFPDEVDSRSGTKVSEFVVGLVFAAFPFSAMVCSPLAGHLCKILGWNIVLTWGMVLCIGSTVAFGLSSNLSEFFAFRILQGAGAGAIGVAGTSVLVSRFPDDLGSALGLMEATAGVAFMIGPAVGGALFEAGGFVMPFLVLSSVAAVVLVLIHLVFRDLCLKRGSRPVENASAAEISTADAAVAPKYSGESPAGLPFTDILNPFSCFAAACVVLGIMIPGFLDPTLAQHVEQVLGVGPTGAGAVFLIATASYAVFGAVAGWATDQYGGRGVITVGMVLATLGCIFIGPAPPLRDIFPNTQGAAWGCVVPALLLLGSAAAFISVPAVPVMKNSLLVLTADGAENHIATLFSIAQGLGECLGPLIGGALTGALPQTNALGCAVSLDEDCKSRFPWASCAIGGLFFVMIFPVWIFLPAKRDVTSTDPFIEALLPKERQDPTLHDALSGEASKCSYTSPALM